MNSLQYIFFVFAIAGSFLVGSRSRRTRLRGFICFIIANSIMIAWALYRGDALGIVLTNIIFTVAAIRGIVMNWSKNGQ